MGPRLADDLLGTMFHQVRIKLSPPLTHFQMTNFRLFQTERVCRKLSKWVENAVGKGDIARYEQFLLCQQCFQKACFPGASKGVIVSEWVNKSIIQIQKEFSVLWLEICRNGSMCALLSTKFFLKLSVCGTL